MDFNVNGSTVYIGRRGDFSTYFNGYLAEVNFIDGYRINSTSTVATFSDFGETKNGVWVPKEYKPYGSSNEYGVNGFRLTFSNANNVGEDSSGQGNNWTATGF